MKKIYLALALPIVLVACSKAPQATPATSSGSMMPNASSTAAMGPMVVALSEQNKSGQSGTATLTESNGQVTVAITMTGKASTVPQPAHIHVGSCPTPGAVKYPLSNVVNGASTTTIPVTLAALQAMGPLSINVHKSAQELAVYTACGNLATNANMQPGGASGSGAMMKTSAPANINY